MNSSLNTEQSQSSAIDTYDYGSLKNVSWFTKLLWYSAGADAQLLMRCPFSDRVKYQGLGGVVLSVGLIAFFSGSYAFYAIFSPKTATTLADSSLHVPTAFLSVFFGAFWALVIYNLDRFIVYSTGKGDGTDRITKTEFFNALPRLFMAIIIGVCLSAPLEIKILESEIKAQLEIEQNEYLQTLNEQSEKLFKDQRIELRGQLDDLQGRIDESDAQLETRRLEINTQSRQLELEAQGKLGNGIAGRGPAWQDKRENLDRMQAELDRDRQTILSKNQLIIDEINDSKIKLAALDEELSKQKASNEKSAQHLDGLLKRIQISHEIGGIVPIAIMLLLLSIETGPIFFKLMLIKGAYDYLEDNQKKLARAAAGIEPDVYMVSENGESILVDRYHGAESLLGEQKRQMATEDALSVEIHTSYANKKVAEIQKNPNAYVQTKERK